MHARRLVELAFCAGAGGCLLADAPAEAQTARQSLAHAEDVQIRKGADGAGPSQLIAIGGDLLVVDPRERQIIRYAKDDLAAPPVRCRIDQDPGEWPRFSPWRSVTVAGAVHLVAEPYGPGTGTDYDFINRSTMVIDQAGVARMKEGASCPFRIRGYDRLLDAPLRFRWSAGEKPGSAALVTFGPGKVARIVPRGGRRAEIFAVRQAGLLGDGRQLLWWSELDGYPLAPPVQGATPSGPAFGGRITSSQYVGVFPPTGGEALKVVRIENAAYAPIAAGAPFPRMDGVDKLGFEYAVGGTVGGKDMLWIAASDMASTEPYKPFHLRRYRLDLAGTDFSVVLTKQGAESGDRNDGQPPDDRSKDVARFAGSEARIGWFKKIREQVRAQVGYRWTYPKAAVGRPCGGADECEVGVDAATVYGTGADYPGKRGRWIRPVQLNGLRPGTEVRGVPYSYGNEQRVYPEGHPEAIRRPQLDFARQLSADYGPTPVARPRPIGHIRQSLGSEGRGSTYPLGIDCAALVARIFGVTWRATGEILEPNGQAVGEGFGFNLPKGPERGCPEPVRYISEIQPGDILIKAGHVVIYSEMARIGGAGGTSRGMRVFESSSRCGGVCESVYDPSFFDGWWILRFRRAKGDDADCPRWLRAAAEAAKPRQ